MAKPTILAVDDERAVLAAVGRDLQRRYGPEYRILRAGSGAEALEALRQLRLEDAPVALLVVDQRMPGLSGVQFLHEAIRIYPDVKRVLLTAYADTDAAIRAINDVRLDHYLMKPWDPPEEHLYPVVDDLLSDWRAHFRPPFEGVRLLGHPWSAEGHRLKDFLARNLIPFRWLDVEADEEARDLMTLAGGPEAPLPMVVFPDGATLSKPPVADLADRLGLHRQAQSDTYDLIIVGAGPAGLAAGVYGASEGLRTLLVEREAPGGQAGMSSAIENYLGFPVGLSGADLARRATAQARRFGAEILTPREAHSFETRDGYHILHLSDGGQVAAQALVIATGISYRRLDVPGADRVTGAGLYYGAAMTEALAASGKDVFVLGGGNSAGQAALYLARFARSVTVVVRGSSLAAGMSHYLVERIESAQNIVVRTRTVIGEVHGERSVEALTLVCGEDGASEKVPAAALFLFIGAEPRTEWLEGRLALDARGYILTGPQVMRGDHRPDGWTATHRDPLWLETSVAGVFAAGDVRHRSTKRIASAVGEGAMAVQFVHQHLGGAVLAPEGAPTGEAGA